MLQRSSAAQTQSLLSPPSRTVAPRARRTTVPRRSPGPYPRPCSSHSPSARRPGEVFAHQQQQPSPWSPLDRSRRRQQQPQQHSNSRPRAEATRLEPSEPAREPRQSRPESRAARRPERRATPVREPCHAGPSAVPTSRPESRRCSRCSPSRPRAKRRAWSRRSRPESRARAGQRARESNTQLLASVPNPLPAVLRRGSHLSRSHEWAPQPVPHETGRTGHSGWVCVSPAGPPQSPGRSIISGLVFRLGNCCCILAMQSNVCVRVRRLDYISNLCGVKGEEPLKN